MHGEIEGTKKSLLKTKSAERTRHNSSMKMDEQTSYMSLNTGPCNDISLNFVPQTETMPTPTSIYLDKPAGKKWATPANVSFAPSENNDSTERTFEL